MGQSGSPKRRGYFLSAEDADQLRAIGEAIGFPFDAWLADRTQSSFVKRMEQQSDFADRFAEELDSTYRHLRAVIENCRHQDAAAIRHQLVGLLPEVQTHDPDVAAKMREKGLGHLVERQEWMAQGNWSDYGYGEPPEGWEPGRFGR